MILAIGSRNDFLHVYQNEGDLVADNAIGTGRGRFSGPIEFFDSDGHRLNGAHDGQGNLQALKPTSDPPDLLALVQRVRNAFGPLRSSVEENPGQSIPEVVSALTRLPHLSTPADLQEFLQVFASQPASENAIRPRGPDGVEPGRPGHNWLHQMGIGHD